MLTAPLIERLTTLRLRGMAASLEQQLASPDVHRLPFEDRLTLMIEQELLERGGILPRRPEIRAIRVVHGHLRHECHRVRNAGVSGLGI